MPLKNLEKGVYKHLIFNSAIEMVLKLSHNDILAISKEGVT